MRKKKFIYAALTLLTLGFAACQQEEDFAPQGSGDEIRISFTTDAIQTRVITLGTGDKWENGDELYFCRISGDNEWAEYSLTATVADEVTTWTPQ